MARRGKKKSLFRRIRRILFLASAATAIVRFAMSRRPKTQPLDARPAEWAPLTTATTTSRSSASSPTTTATDTATDTDTDTDTDTTSTLPLWVEPVDGACPLTHPVKGNSNSGIYHVAGGRFYDATIPERCYRDTAAAEEDGMRASKR
jgi:hypothetical protein